MVHLIGSFSTAGRIAERRHTLQHLFVLENLCQFHIEALSDFNWKSRRSHQRKKAFETEARQRFFECWQLLRSRKSPLGCNRQSSELSALGKRSARGHRADRQLGYARERVLKRLRCRSVWNRDKLDARPAVEILSYHPIVRRRRVKRVVQLTRARLGVVDKFGQSCNRQIRIDR